MTKKQMVERILVDMCARSDSSVEEVEARWRGWLGRQTKDMLRKICLDRGLAS